MPGFGGAKGSRSCERGTRQGCGADKPLPAFALRGSARELTEVIEQAWNRLCSLLSHPGTEDGKFPLSLSLVPKWEHGLLGEDSTARGPRPAGRTPGPSCVVARPSGLWVLPAQHSLLLAGLGVSAEASEPLRLVGASAWGCCAV